MTKISDLGMSSSCPVSDSLGIIRQTHVQLHALTDVTTTTNVLTTRIELCDVLLGEISGIRSSLAKDLQSTRKPPLALRQLLKKESRIIARTGAMSRVLRIPSRQVSPPRN